MKPEQEKMELTTISIDKTTWKKLSNVKIKYEFDTFDKAIKELLVDYNDKDYYLPTTENLDRLHSKIARCKEDLELMLKDMETYYPTGFPLEKYNSILKKLKALNSDFEKANCKERGAK